MLCLRTVSGKLFCTRPIACQFPPPDLKHFLLAEEPAGFGIEDDTEVRHRSQTGQIRAVARPWQRPERGVELIVEAGGGGCRPGGLPPWPALLSIILVKRRQHLIDAGREVPANSPFE